MINSQKWNCWVYGHEHLSFWLMLTTLSTIEMSPVYAHPAVYARFTKLQHSENTLLRELNDLGVTQSLSCCGSLGSPLNLSDPQARSQRSGLRSDPCSVFPWCLTHSPLVTRWEKLELPRRVGHERCPKARAMRANCSEPGARQDTSKQAAAKWFRLWSGQATQQAVQP